MSRRLLLAIRLATVALALGLLAQAVDLGASARMLLALPAGAAAAGLALGLLRAGLMALRWRTLDAAPPDPDAGSVPPPLPFAAYLRYRLLNSTFSLVLPSGLAGDAGRAALLALEVPEGRGARVAVIAFDRLLGLLTVALLGLVAGLLAPALPHRGAYLLGVGGLLVGLLGLLAAAGAPPLHRRLERARECGLPGAARLAEGVEGAALCSRRLLRARGRLAGAVVLAFLAHSCSFGLVVVAAHALGVGAPLPQLLAVTTVGWVVAILPVSIGGLGVRELVFVGMLAPYGVAPAAAASLAFFQFLVVVALGVGTLPLLLWGAPRRPSLAALPAEVADADPS